MKQRNARTRTGTGNCQSFMENLERDMLASEGVECRMVVGLSHVIDTIRVSLAKVTSHCPITLTRNEHVHDEVTVGSSYTRRPTRGHMTWSSLACEVCLAWCGRESGAVTLCLPTQACGSQWRSGLVGLAFDGLPRGQDGHQTRCCCRLCNSH